MITFACSGCGKNFQVKAEFAGRKTKCPKCGQALLVPTPPAPAPVSTPSVKPPPKTPARSPAGVLERPVPVSSASAAAFENNDAPDVRRLRRDRGRAPLLVGLGAGALLLIGVSVLAALWATGSFSKAPKEEPALAQNPPATPVLPKPENEEPESKPKPKPEPKGLETQPGRQPGPTDIRKLQPLIGMPVDRGVALERFSKTMPVEETKKWLEALAKTTGKDNSTLFLQCVSTFGHKMGALFDGDKFKADVSAKMLKRLNSLEREDFRQWHDAFNTVMEQPCSDTAVALQLLTVDLMFEGDTYADAKGKKYLNRVKQLKRTVVNRWCEEVPAFKDEELDAALSLAILERFFEGEKFNLAAFDKALGAKTEIGKADPPETKPEPQPLPKPEPKTRAHIVVPTKEIGRVDAIVFSPDSKKLLVGNRPPGAALNGRVSVWNIADAKKEKDLISGRLHFTTVLGYSPDGKILAMGGIIQMTLNDGATGKNISALGESASVIAFSADSKTLLSNGGNLDGKIKVWDVMNPEVDASRPTPSTKLRTTLKEHSKAVECLAWASDGQTFASGSADSTIKVWNASQYKVVTTLEGHKGSVLAIAYSPSSKSLVSAGDDKTVRFWNLVTQKQLAVGQAHDASVNHVAIHPEGKLAVTAGSDQQVILWNMDTQQKVVALPIAHKYARSLALSPDGQWLAVLSDEIDSLSVDPRIEIWKFAELLQLTTTSTKEPAKPAGKEPERSSGGEIWAKAEYAEFVFQLTKEQMDAKQMASIDPAHLPKPQAKGQAKISDKMILATAKGLPPSSLSPDEKGGLKITLNILREESNSWPAEAKALATELMWGSAFVTKPNPGALAYNLLLTGKPDTKGIYRGKASGILANGTKFYAVDFVMSPRRFGD